MCLLACEYSEEIQQKVVHDNEKEKYTNLGCVVGGDFDCLWTQLLEKRIL